MECISSATATSSQQPPTLTNQLTANAGYALGTRLDVKGTSDRISLNLTQKGAVVGVQFYF
jgi:hypothetical protein